ncbi:UspA domain-containing protein [Spiribacter salinus M19-40]|uniref:UspA domain-containing protein n=1 Tax=Spiribacter salinus M19-40 TaxID=1260251 RepID=R4V755_9GAMM|nr:universal stress protein [Spiribacter salinus]AGM40845.1 UspA domain-containing protein [Spiribacter salinus M19-40]
MSKRPAIILVPVDGSDGANESAAYAAGLAEALNVPLRLLFAFPRDPVDMFGVPTEAPQRDELEYFSPDAFARLRDRSARQAFDTARQAIGQSQNSVEETILAGSPAEAIVEHAGQTTDPMIVIGSRGLSGFKEMLLGSVSQRVLHRAGCPVTVVR